MGSTSLCWPWWTAIRHNSVSKQSPSAFGGKGPSDNSRACACCQTTPSAFHFAIGRSRAAKHKVNWLRGACCANGGVAGAAPNIATRTPSNRQIHRSVVPKGSGRGAEWPPLNSNGTVAASTLVRPCLGSGDARNLARLRFSCTRPFQPCRVQVLRNEGPSENGISGSRVKEGSRLQFVGEPSRAKCLRTW